MRRLLLYLLLLTALLVVVGVELLPALEWLRATLDRLDGGL